MDGAFDIPDSTDWLNTPLKDFSTLENALHCQICKEFYDTPMITSCCHTFCSKCIRTSLSTDGKCPACRASDQANKLRNNWALQEVVTTFLAARPAALEVARKEQEEATGTRDRGKRKRAVLDADDVVEVEQDRRTTRSKTRRIAASQNSESEPIEIEDSDQDGDGDFMPEQQPDDGLVECPLGCGKRMKIEAVEPHLDRCEEEKQQSRAKSRTPVNALGYSKPPSTQSSKPQDRISELNYSLLTDTKLRTKLRDAGIPNWGSKQLQIKRHTEWVNLWNANCDSNNPRSKRELLHELDRWERTQGGSAPSTNGLSSSVMRKDFDGVGWINKNKDDFSRLIAEAQRKKHNPALEPERPKEVKVNGDERSQHFTTSIDEHISNLTDSDALANGLPDINKPYENNPEAISSVRAKVAAANNGQHIEPIMNSGFDRTPIECIPTPVTSSPHDAEHRNHISLRRESSLQDHLARENSATQKLSSSPMKKLPMFTLPQVPVTDVDAEDHGQ